MDSKLLVNLTNEASVSGKTETAVGTEKPVYTFLGIPYAAPPVGERRFQPPAKLEYWTGTRDATKHGPICPQNYELSEQVHKFFPFPKDRSEDCLYLNIYTPDPDPKKKYPVMFWIHGGGFSIGFLCTGEDGEVNGNAGILDLIAALQWVQQHIAKFGGDPDNVTIFGESAGGMCVSYLVVSDLSKGLFHRAISQSGVCMNTKAVKTQEYAGKFLRSRLEAQGFTSSDSQEILAHLKSMSVEDLIKLPGENAFPIVYDKNLLNDFPRNIYNANKQQQVEYMIGFNSTEGAMFSIFFQKDIPLNTKENGKKFIQNLIENMFFKDVPNVSKITEAAYNRYVEPVEDEKIANSVTDMIGDMVFVAPSIYAANKHSETANVRTFVYLFDHHPSWSENPAWVRADHGDDILMVLGAPFLERPEHKWPEEEKQLSMDIMKYWTNFARTGDPNGAQLQEWPSYSKEGKDYIIIKTQPEVESNYNPEMVDFWMETVENI